MNKISGNRKILIISLFLFPFNLVFGQDNSTKTNHFGTWNLVNLKYNHNKSIFVTLEGQLRSLGTFSDFHYHEYSTSTHYKISPNSTLTLGIGKYDTYKEGGNFVLPKNNDEIRVWPQITTYQRFEHITIEHRYRMELRFASNNYKNRYRYRLGIQVPFGKLKDGYIPYSIQLNNELFFSENEPYFERNRMQGIYNYKPTRKMNLQVGYLYQFDYKIVDEIGRSFLMFGINFEIYKKEVNKNPIIE